MWMTAWYADDLCEKVLCAKDLVGGILVWKDLCAKDLGEILVWKDLCGKTF